MSDYEIINKIKSQKWNAFLLESGEVEAYLQDGKPIPDVGLFSKFSKEKKENDTRRNERMVQLLSPRIINNKEDWGNYVHNNVEKIDKEIISMIVEPTKNIFNRDASFILKSDKKSNNEKLKKLIMNGETESGDIVAIYPVSVIQNKISKGVLFITTKGICFISINESNSSVIAPYAVANALGGLGAIAVGVAAITAKYLAHSIDGYKIDKEQQSIINLSAKYSPCLIARCFDDSQFIPFNMINGLIYGIKSNGNKFIFNCLYQNIQKRVTIEAEHNIMNKIIENLSEDHPPKIKQIK